MLSVAPRCQRYSQRPDHDVVMVVLIILFGLIVTGLFLQQSYGSSIWRRAGETLRDRYDMVREKMHRSDAGQAATNPNADAGARLCRSIRGEPRFCETRNALNGTHLNTSADRAIRRSKQRWSMRRRRFPSHHRLRVVTSSIHGPAGSRREPLSLRRRRKLRRIVRCHLAKRQTLSK